MRKDGDGPVAGPEAAAAVASLEQQRPPQPPAKRSLRSLFLPSFLSALLLLAAILLITSMDPLGGYRWGCDNAWVRFSWPDGAPPT